MVEAIPELVDFHNFSDCFSLNVFVYLTRVEP